MPEKPKTIDEYLSAVSKDQRAALEKLRQQIRKIVPGAEECISYGLAAFRLKGKCFAGFGTSAKHCSFYPMSGSTVAEFQDELKNFETTKGSIHFQPGKPLPARLIRNLIEARLAEIGG